MGKSGAAPSLLMAVMSHSKQMTRSLVNSPASLVTISMVTELSRQVGYEPQCRASPVLSSPLGLGTVGLRG